MSQTKLIPPGEAEHLPLLYEVFRVAEDGTIYRAGEDGYEIASQCRTSRRGRYLSVSRMVGKKQRHYYVHRLVAEAYIPNPQAKPCVNHKDGNGHNNHVSNLEWVTHSENMQHAYDVGLNIAYRNACINCGTPIGRGHIGNRCVACDKIAIDAARKLRARKAAVTKARHAFGGIDPASLTPRQREAVTMSLSGASNAEIARELGVSGQAVGNMLGRMRQKNTAPDGSNVKSGNAGNKSTTRLTREGAAVNG